MNSAERGLMAALALSGVPMVEVCPSCGGTSDRCDDVQGGACLTCMTGTILAPTSVVELYQRKLAYQAEQIAEHQVELRILRPLAPDHHTDTWHHEDGRLTLTRLYSDSHRVSTSEPLPAGSPLELVGEAMRRLRAGIPISWHTRKTHQLEPRSRVYLKETP